MLGSGPAGRQGPRGGHFGQNNELKKYLQNRILYKTEKENRRTKTTQKMLTSDFVLAFISQFTFSIVYHILYPTLPIYLSRLGSTEADIGVLIGILGVSSLVCRPFVGRALLKTPEKTFMIMGTLLFAVTSAAYLLASPFWPILTVRVFQGIGLAFFYTASLTFISNISPETQKGQSLSYFLLSVNISLALAPSLGMVIINRFDFTLLFLVCLGLSLCSLFTTNKLGKRPIAPSEYSSKENGFLLSRKALPSCILSFFFHFTWGALTAFFPLYAINHGVANPGLFFTGVAMTLIVGRVLGGKVLDLYGPERIILPCLIACILSTVILAFSKTLSMFILVSVIWGIGHAFLFPALLVHALDRMGASRGPAMGMFTGISDLGMSLGPVLMGIIIHWTSYPIMFLCLAFAGMISLNYFYFFVRKKG
jgi:MFS family permease